MREWGGRGGDDWLIQLFESRKKKKKVQGLSDLTFKGGERPGVYRGGENTEPFSISLASPCGCAH